MTLWQPKHQACIISLNGVLLAVQTHGRSSLPLSVGFPLISDRGVAHTVRGRNISICTKRSK